MTCPGSSRQAGIEIIPFEPDQRSDLRRESPQCRTYLTPLSPRGLGQFQELLTFFVLFTKIATTRLQASTLKVFLGPLLAMLSTCSAVVFASFLALDRELCRELLRFELHWCRQVCIFSYSNTTVDSPPVILDLLFSWVYSLVGPRQYGKFSARQVAC